MTTVLLTISFFIIPFIVTWLVLVFNERVSLYKLYGKKIKDIELYNLKVTIRSKSKCTIHQVELEKALDKVDVFLSSNSKYIDYNILRNIEISLEDDIENSAGVKAYGICHNIYFSWLYFCKKYPIGLDNKDMITYNFSEKQIANLILHEYAHQYLKLHSEYKDGDYYHQDKIWNNLKII